MEESSPVESRRKDAGVSEGGRKDGEKRGRTSVAYAM